MPSAPSKGLPPGYDVPLWAPSSSSGWTGPRVVLPPKAGVPVGPPRVVLPSAARVVLPPKAVKLEPMQPLHPPPHFAAEVGAEVEQIAESDSDDEICYDSSGRLMVDKGAGRSSLAPTTTTTTTTPTTTSKPTSKQDRLCTSIVDQLVTPIVNPSWSLDEHDEDGEFDYYKKFNDWDEEHLKPKLEPKVEPKEEAEEGAESEELYAMQSPKSKAPPPHRIKAELNEAPARFAKRLKAVKTENEDEDEASASASCAAAVVGAFFA